MNLELAEDNVEPLAGALRIIHAVMGEGARKHPRDDWRNRTAGYHIRRAMRHLELLEAAFKADTFDIGVLDPRYKQGSDRTRYRDRYGDKPPRTEQQCDRQYYAALPGLLRVCRQGLIVKAQDGTEGHGGIYDRRTKIINRMEALTDGLLSLYGDAYVERQGAANMNTQGQQRCLQQRFSYFLIWKWCNKNPWKRYRFQNVRRRKSADTVAMAASTS